MTGSFHIVRPGETLAAIGRIYSISWQTLAQVNHLTNPHHLEVGQSISIPSPVRDSHYNAAVLAMPVRLAPAQPLQWPTTGTLSSAFGLRGGRFHGGIDVSAERGTPIIAAAAGVVLFSGRGPAGYGNMIMLDHGGGLVTLYAHNDQNLVREGQRVQRGQPLGLMGDSGRASGTHLHFEVHQDGKLVDPLRWLQ